MSDWLRRLGNPGPRIGLEPTHALSDAAGPLFRAHLAPPSRDVVRAIGASVYGALVADAGPEATAEWVEQWLPQARSLAAVPARVWSVETKNSAVARLAAALANGPTEPCPSLTAAAHLARAGECDPLLARFFGAGVVALVVASLEAADGRST